MWIGSSVFVGSFGNILALGLSKVHTRSVHGWRWILVSAIAAMLSSFMVIRSSDDFLGARRSDDHSSLFLWIF